MAELFENEISVDMPEDMPEQLDTVQSIERWMLVVIRGNSVDVEILNELYRTQAEADQQRDWQQSRWKNVVVVTTKIAVELPPGTKLLGA